MWRFIIYTQERTLIMDNFRTTNGFGFKCSVKKKTAIEIKFINQFQKLKTEEKCFPFEEILNTTSNIFATIESLQKMVWIGR